MKHRNYVWLMASALTVLGCGSLAAQEAHVSVAWKISPACGTNFPSAVLQQNLEDQLRAESIAVSRVYTAGLTADISCQSAGMRSVATQQCLALSQAVPQPSAANGLHLATTWRNCQSYTCSKQNCSEFARATQRTLFGQFISVLRARKAQSKVPGAPAAAMSGSSDRAPTPFVSASVPTSILNPGAIIYMLYILTCMAVLARWQWCRHTAFSARHGAAATLNR
jgi:hypothetical protein